MLKHNYCVLGWEPGLGKSIASLAVAVKTGGTTIVVCPPFLSLNWYAEIKKWIPDAVISLFKRGKDIYFPVDSDFIIIPYTMVDKGKHIFKCADTVIADEAHMVKNMETIRTEALHDAVFDYQPKRLILATGTPIKNRVVEFYSLLVLCGYIPRPDNGLNAARIYPTLDHFADEFSFSRLVRLPNGMRVKKYFGVKNVDKLKKLLKGKYLRRLSKEELDLSDPIFKDYLAKNTNDKSLQKEWEEFQKSSKDKVDSSAKAKSALAKVKYTIEYVENLFEEGLDKVIIYSDHVQPVHLIAEHFGVPHITGAVDSDVRFHIAQKFESGETKVLVATLESFSTGINLTTCCNTVFNDLSWIPATNSQAIGRTLRIGQTRPVIIHRVLGSKQDVNIVKSLRSKEYVIDQAVN